MRVPAALLSLAITSGCCGSPTVAPFDAPSRPELVGLTPSEILATPESVLEKFDTNILEIQEYVLKTESRVRIANGNEG